MGYKLAQTRYELLTSFSGFNALLRPLYLSQLVIKPITRRQTINTGFNILQTYSIFRDFNFTIFYGCVK